LSELIGSEVDKGYLSGPFNEIPFFPYRVNPIGLAESKYSKKKRLIVDLSAPHNNESNPGLNDLISKEEFSLPYVSIDDAIKIIKRMGNGALLINTDITDAFKIMLLSPDMWPYHCIKWEEKYYFFNRLVLGSQSR
jgi:hypothetical protein